jgi:hypothetical protein
MCQTALINIYNNHLRICGLGLAITLSVRWRGLVYFKIKTERAAYTAIVTLGLNSKMSI